MIINNRVVTRNFHQVSKFHNPFSLSGLKTVKHARINFRTLKSIKKKRQKKRKVSLPWNIPFIYTLLQGPTVVYLSPISRISYSRVCLVRLWALRFLNSKSFSSALLFHPIYIIIYCFYILSLQSQILPLWTFNGVN